MGAACLLTLCAFSLVGALRTTVTIVGSCSTWSGVVVGSALTDETSAIRLARDMAVSPGLGCWLHLGSSHVVNGSGSPLLRVSRTRGTHFALCTSRAKPEKKKGRGLSPSPPV